jgi:hypothetical protein
MKEKEKNIHKAQMTRLASFGPVLPTRNLLVLSTFLPFVSSLYQVLETTCLVPLIVVVVGFVVVVADSSDTLSTCQCTFTRCTAPSIFS